jgi:hypothetical protein
MTSGRARDWGRALPHPAHHWVSSWSFEEGGLEMTYEHQNYCASWRDRLIADLHRLLSNAHVPSTSG